MFYFRACLFGRLSVVKFLKEKGARIDAKDTDNFTPLMCAVWKGQNEVVKYLIENGAKTYLTDMNRKTVLHLAIEEESSDTFDLLLESGCEDLINLNDKDYRTPLHYAAMKGNVKVWVNRTTQFSNLFERTCV